MTKTVAVFTGTRADYGLLYWLLKDIEADPALRLQLVVSGSHLSEELGYTLQGILDDGFGVDAQVPILSELDTPVAIAASMGRAVTGVAEALAKLQPDVLVILGDRYEALAAAQAALLLSVPVLHLHGGEISEGANDDAMRHAITKLSTLHCTAAEPYRQRVIQMGESPQRVFNVGAIGLDHLTRSSRMDRHALSRSLNWDLSGPFVVATYHPVTLADEPAKASFEAMLAALDDYPELKVILTYPNADEQGRSLIPALEAYAQQRPERVLAIPSLGQKRYLSAVAEAEMVIGNSSSGLIEVPALARPTVNIGQRQLGRLAADSVFHCAANRTAIAQAMAQALAWRESGQRARYLPYGGGDASGQVVELLKSMPAKPASEFYDLPQKESA
ncbi:UDP-N-acetylglucosamine 2-epimerase [Ferrimonas marina]|uniref:UDP-N-acetylglucosamine 2-epimerase (Non-hydrolysing) n=1 Tax=Ferrimonas marina TaxID=299255 RepID=A0A1M5QUV3_9GAMM|nr:UDP-N-acetylglucosamine 2-epimerase [Ferrimonas marina]SHH17738.1 UDP-N-acetylglucosamine 2-epimerase (non-hydrolysing) [Ferrimonas marina]